MYVLQLSRFALRCVESGLSARQATCHLLPQPSIYACSLLLVISQRPYFGLTYRYIFKLKLEPQHIYLLKEPAAVSRPHSAHEGFPWCSRCKGLMGVNQPSFPCGRLNLPKPLPCVLGLLEGGSTTKRSSKCRSLQAAFHISTI